MAVESGDIKIRLSTQSATEGDDVASTPAESIGGFMSTTDLVDATLENLFPNISAAQAAAGVTLYRCVFVLNSNASDTWEEVKAWLVSQQAGGGTVAIGLDPAGAVAGDANTAQAEAPADEETAPDGVTFSNPTTIDSALDLVELEAGEAYAIWLRLTVPPDVEALNLDNAIMRVRGVSEP